MRKFGRRRFGIRAQVFYCRAGLFYQLRGFDEGLEIGEDLEFLRPLQAEAFPPVTLSRLGSPPPRVAFEPSRSVSALRDGTRILPGDWVVELRLHNASLSASGTDSPWPPLTVLRQDLRALQELLARNRLAAAHGVTVSEALRAICHPAGRGHRPPLAGGGVASTTP